MNTNTTQYFALMLVALVLVGIVASRIATQCQAHLTSTAQAITNVSK